MTGGMQGEDKVPWECQYQLASIMLIAGVMTMNVTDLDSEQKSTILKKSSMRQSEICTSMSSNLLYCKRYIKLV